MMVDAKIPVERIPSSQRRKWLRRLHRLRVGTMLGGQKSPEPVTDLLRARPTAGP